MDSPVLLGIVLGVVLASPVAIYIVMRSRRRPRAPSAEPSSAAAYYSRPPSEEEQILAEVRAIEKAHVPEKRPSFREAIGKAFAEDKWGKLNPAMICPHCQQKGAVRAKPVERARGISGGKAIGALLTGGVSLVATGISRHEKQTQAHCDNCGSTWDF